MSAIVFMAGFAAVWWVAGLVLGPLPLGWAAIGPLASAGLILFARRRLKAAPRPTPEAAKRAGRVVGWAGGLEGLAIFAASQVLLNLGLSAYLACAMAVIVGLHFLPLAALLKVRAYYVSGPALVLAGLGGIAVDAAHRWLAVGVAAAVILWLTCGARLAEVSPRPAAA